MAVLILLPPSETKHARRRGFPADPAGWSFPELTPTRERVAAALREASAAPDAPARLGVSPGLLDEVARNLVLDTSPATRVADLYTGVLYDALDLPSMDAAARRRAWRWLVVVSALYGALRPRDLVAAYRLSMSADLPGLTGLAREWRGPLDPVLTAAAGRGAVVDMRSAPYAAAWTPTGAVRERWVQVRVPGASHHAKHTRGLVARRLCVEGVDARTPARVADVVARGFTTTLHEPTGPTRPWVLDVTP